MRKMFLSLGLVSTLLFGSMGSTFAASPDEQQSSINQMSESDYEALYLTTMKDANGIINNVTGVLKNGNIADEVIALDASAGTIDNMLTMIRQITPPDKYQFAHTLMRSFLFSLENSFFNERVYLETGSQLKANMAEEYIKAANAFNSMLGDEMKKQGVTN